MPTATLTRRTELADFLRTRRERLTPDDVGLPAGGRRRTPGLRREEVAMLAGVGVTWYTWLEQGRSINASAQVLESLARTLRMDMQERWHLFQLADLGPVPPVAAFPGVSESARATLDKLDPFPAAVVSPRYDIVAYNRAYNWVFGDLDSMDPRERNTIWLFFARPALKDLWLNREGAAAHLVGKLRAAMARHVDDPLWTDFVRRLREVSEEFDDIWRRHNVVGSGMPAKDFASPVGDLHLQVANFEVVEHGGGARMHVYTPRDEVTAQRLEGLPALDARRAA